MTPAKELPIVIEKSQEDVDQIIALVHSSNLPEGSKPFIIGCIHLASWIPRALVEHKITVSNLKRIIFGKGDKTTKQQDKSLKAEENTTDAEESEASPSNDESNEPKEPTGHGRLPHTAYINAQEHTIVSKYQNHLPLYRQEKIWEVMGIHIPRNATCGWIIHAADVCMPMREALIRALLESNYLQADETPFQIMNEPGRNNTLKRAVLQIISKVQNIKFQTQISCINQIVH